MNKKNYLNNKDLLEEIKLSKKQGFLTIKAQKMLILIANEAIKKLPYFYPEDRKDCLQFAIHDLLKYWHNFDVDKYKNAFAYYTEIAKRGYAKGWNILYPKKYAGTLRIDGCNDNNEFNNIYSLGY